MHTQNCWTEQMAGNFNTITIATDVYNKTKSRISRAKENATLEK